MKDTLVQNLDSLISIGATDQNFSVVVSNLQSLSHYLQHNSSPQCEDDYLRLMAHLLENYLDEPKQLFLRNVLTDMIASQTQDKYAAQYFKERFTSATLLDLLTHHRNLTGKCLIVTTVDYKHQKFKVRLTSCTTQQ